MKTIANNDQYIIIFDDQVIEDLASLNNSIKKIKGAVKEVLMDLRHVQYAHSSFLDYIGKCNMILIKKNIKLKLVNCPDNIYSLFTKTFKDSEIEIKPKDI
ncbi:MAG: hypothetical protein KKH98_13430 [Spirochaetes bacterium]|nr:hypothetical protein [Spirochaetota bacterium]